MSEERKAHACPRRISPAIPQGLASTLRLICNKEVSCPPWRRLRDYGGQAPDINEYTDSEAGGEADTQNGREFEEQAFHEVTSFERRR